jgi:hypothetical protein
MAAQIPQEQPQTQPTTPPMVPPVKPKKNIVLTVALILLFLIMAAALGYLGYQNYQLRLQISNLSSNTTQLLPTPTASPATNSGTVSNWKTYKNSDLSFEYPESWTLNGFQLQGNSPNIVVNIVTKGSTLMNECMKKDSIEDKGGFVVKRFSRVTTGEMCSTSDGTPREIWIIPSETSYSPGISFRYSENDSKKAEEIFTKLVSTFKFVN